MSKSFRGRNLRELPASGRGLCAQCKREGVKTLHEVEIDGAKTRFAKFVRLQTKTKLIKQAN